MRDRKIGDRVEQGIDDLHSLPLVLTERETEAEKGREKHTETEIERERRDIIGGSERVAGMKVTLITLITHLGKHVNKPG